MCHLRAVPQREAHLEAGPGGEFENPIHRAADRVGTNHPIALRTVRFTDPRPQQAQVVVDFGRRAHGRATRLGRVLLFDRDGRADAFDALDPGFLHAVEKLLRVRRQRLDVAPLAFGEECVEGERRLPRPGRTRDHGQGTARQIEVQILEIVLPRTDDSNEVVHNTRRTPALSRSSGPTLPPTPLAPGQIRTLPCGPPACPSSPRSP